jgi:putative lipoprotein
MRGRILTVTFAAVLLCGCAAQDAKLGKAANAMDKRGESAAADCGASEGVCKVPAVQGSMIGGGTDEHGCLVAAGQSFSKIKNGCVQVFDVADVRLGGPDNATLAIYGIFSADKSKVEIFWSSLPESVILRAKGSGYVSKDGKISLLKSGNSYKIRRK